MQIRKRIAPKITKPVPKAQASTRTKTDAELKVALARRFPLLEGKILDMRAVLK